MEDNVKRIILGTRKRSGADYPVYTIEEPSGIYKVISPMQFWRVNLKNETTDYVYEFLWRDHLATLPFGKQVDVNMATAKEKENGVVRTSREKYLDLIIKKYKRVTL